MSLSRALPGAVTRPHTVVVLAENREGVLSRMTSLFDARGYMVDSIAVGRAVDPDVLRVVVVVHGDERLIEQALKQLGRLIDVLEVRDLTDVARVERETLLARVVDREENREQLARLAEDFGATIVDRTGDACVLEFLGEEAQVDSLIEALRPLGIQEIVRSGKIAIARGTTSGACE